MINWLTLAIQHLKMQLVADSVTLPSGAVIHAPRLMAETDSLTAGKGSAELHRAETADSSAVKAESRTTHQATEAEANETTTVTKSPDVIAIAIAQCCSLKECTHRSRDMPWHVC